jgi:hypothetical protein
MSGCDTTSALGCINLGKVKFLKILKNNNDLQNVVEIFKNPCANAEAVTNVGLLFLLFLYGFCGKSLPSLNNLRYRCYIK